MASSVALVMAAACSNGAATTTYCVSESGSLSPGSCFTECESRCTLVERAGCGDEATCEKACNAAPAESTACARADYAHWRCLRLAGEPVVICADGGPVTFSEPATICVAERRAMQAACGTTDAGARD